MEKLRKLVYTAFSDTAMIALALLIIPVLIAQNFLNLSPAQGVLISIIDWFIWVAFFLEFTLKLITAEKKQHWLATNKLDSIVSVIVIISPVLEHFFTYFSGAPMLRLLRLGRLTRLTRLIRLVRLIALGVKVKKGWRAVSLKVYAVFFLIAGSGFTASFIATGFQYSPVDVAWISLFVSIFGVFYAVLISFFVVHIWLKFNTIGNEIGKEINALKNAYFLSFQIFENEKMGNLRFVIADYTDEIIKTIWGESNATASHNVDKKFLALLTFFNDAHLSTQADMIVLENIIEELRLSSIAQTNLVNLAQDKTPKILWVLLLLLSTVLIGSFVFLGFQNQLLATALITLVSIVTGLVVALIFDIDTPFQAGFWNISSKPFLDLKDLIENQFQN